MTDTTQNAGLAPEVEDETRTYVLRTIAYFALVHVLGIGALFIGVPWQVILFTGFYFFLCHISISLGAHRWAAHAAFKMHPAVAYPAVTINTGNAQGPKLWWSPKHKKHHGKENKKGDPHSPLFGWFHSHMGWVLTKEGMAPAEKKYAIHLFREKDGEYAPVFWQARHYLVLTVTMAFVVPTAIGALLFYVSRDAMEGTWLFSLLGPVWGSIIGALLINCLRLTLQYHFTWVVNSLCHGGKEGAAVNIWLLAILTVGESFHKNHHDSAGHPRIGRKWWEIDITWYMIWVLWKLGLIWDLKNPNSRAATS